MPESQFRAWEEVPFLGGKSKPHHRVFHYADRDMREGKDEHNPSVYVRKRALEGGRSFVEIGFQPENAPGMNAHAVDEQDLEQLLKVWKLPVISGIAEVMKEVAAAEIVPE